MGKLLVVDDRRDVSEVIEAYLGALGHRVTCLTDGAAARALLAREAFDLALIDVQMPGEGGLSLATVAQRHGVRVLLMSGDPGSLETSSDRHGHRLLCKPFRLLDLEAALAALLDRPVTASD